MKTTLTAAVLTLAAAPAFAGLEQEPRITEGLINVGIAYEISEVCPRLDGRTLRGLQYLLALRSAAMDLGYSRAEVDAFIDDDAAKDRLEAVARARLAAKGAAKGDTEAHCRVGEAELAADSQIGRLLEVD
ncbi:DUF5333 domain-containing protein [Jannaschia sp. M317]|uniref:DUF5333 domain-containing protein n=1 Tax=Jannaschia sp. M317 TaxID=2867011 RepID=UPI0021A7B701|nr:DUF5333 domain-containing protein [Jannaschia sp. M317]UWQ17808.1 DUF5333 domain-containing protein [Jannaschia sp. M317]